MFLKPKGSTKHSKKKKRYCTKHRNFSNAKYFIFRKTDADSILQIHTCLLHEIILVTGKEKGGKLGKWQLPPNVWTREKPVSSPSSLNPVPTGKRLSCFSYHWTLSSSWSQISYWGMREKGERQIVGFPVMWLALCLLKWMVMLLLLCLSSWIVCLKRMKAKTATKHLFLSLRDS